MLELEIAGRRICTVIAIKSYRVPGQAKARSKWGDSTPGGRKKTLNLASVSLSRVLINLGNDPQPRLK